MTCYLLPANPIYNSIFVYSEEKDEILRLTGLRHLGVPAFLRKTLKFNDVRYNEERKSIRVSSLSEIELVSVRELFRSLRKSRRLVESRVADSKQVQEYLEGIYFGFKTTLPFVLSFKPSFLTIERYANIWAIEGVVHTKIPIVLARKASIKSEYSEYFKKKRVFIFGGRISKVDDKVLKVESEYVKVLPEKGYFFFLMGDLF